jgi:hypothetical protein
MPAEAAEYGRIGAICNENDAGLTGCGTKLTGIGRKKTRCEWEETLLAAGHFQPAGGGCWTEKLGSRPNQNRRGGPLDPISGLLVAVPVLGDADPGRATCVAIEVPSCKVPSTISVNCPSEIPVFTTAGRMWFPS